VEPIKRIQNAKHYFTGFHFLKTLNIWESGTQIQILLFQEY